MYIVPSDDIKTAATNPAGSIPLSRIEVYPISGVIADSKGLRRQIYDGYDIETDPNDDDLLWTDASSLMAFNWGDALPLGITEAMLSDGKTWSMKWTGYFRVMRPEGHKGLITYQLGYVSTGYVSIYVDGQKWEASDTHDNFYSSSPHSINESTTRLSSVSEYWVPLTVNYMRADYALSKRQLKDERFVLFWRDSVDNEWRVVGADVTCQPGGRFVNLIGTPVTAVDAPTRLPNNRMYRLNIHQDGSTYHFHIEDGTVEFPLIPGDTITHNLNPGVARGDFVSITWSTAVAHGDQVEVYLVSGEEDPYVLSSVSRIQIDSSKDAASVLRFEVPITTSTYDADNVTRDNQCTYDLATDSFGVLRKGRLIKAYMGYQLDGKPDLVQRFTGLIEDIVPRHAVSGDGATSWTLDVTCLDARTLATGVPVTRIEDLPLGGLPNDLSYDIAQVFPETVAAQGPDGSVRPPAWDRWNLAKVVRTVAYQCGFMSSQLWAKDAHGNFLIEDRDVYLECTPVYPFNVASKLGSRAVAEDVVRSLNVGVTNRETLEPFLSETTPSFVWFHAHKVWGEYADAIEFPYIFRFNVDTEPWQGLLDICQSYGLELGVNTEGNVYVRYPANPKIYNMRASSSDDSGNYVLTHDGNGWTYEDDPYAIGNEVLKSTLEASYMLAIRFTGVGIKLILPRTAVGGSRVIVAIDDPGVVVGGLVEDTDSLNVLDSTTGDTGHPEWTDYVDHNKGDSVDLYLAKSFSGKNRWYYSDGIHPGVGRNPCVYTICDNLTYGTHTAYIMVYGSSVVRIEGFMPIVRSTEHEVHEFNSNNTTGITVEETAPALVNDVVVVGSQTGAAGENVVSRMVDLGSVTDEDSANFIGRRRTWLISSPKVIDQHRADFLAQHVINRYRSGYRTVQVETVGLPWLEPGDPVLVRDVVAITNGTHPLLGLYAPDDLTVPQRSGSEYAGIMSVPFQHYWVTDVSEEMRQEQDTHVYTARVQTTTLPPLPAYEPLPEPDQDQFTYPVTELKIDHDGSTYNPYLADKEGEYVDITFNLNWHASMLAVRIICTEEIKRPVGDDLKPGDVVNSLVVRTGFIPAGYYEFAWDGWMVIEQDTGLYAPSGTYCVEIETVRYSTNVGFICRSDSDLSGLLAAGSKESIVVSRDPTVYTSPRFSATVSPFTAGTHSHTNPPIVYDDTNDGRGVQIDVTLECPARVELTVHVRHMIYPESEYTKTKPVDVWDIHLRGPESPVLEPGTYTFYFTPSTMLVKDGRTMSLMHHNRLWTGSDADEAWWECFHCRLLHYVRCVDKAGADGIVEGQDNSGIDGKTNYLVDTTTNFKELGVAPGRLLRNRTDDDSYAVITSISTTTNPDDTVHFTGGLQGGTFNVVNNHDVYIIEGVMDSTIAQAFPYGYEFIWGGPTVGTYPMVSRTEVLPDLNETWYYTYFKVKD